MGEPYFPGVFRLWYRDRQGNRVQTATYYIKFYVHGKPIRERTGLTDAREANALRRRRLEEAHEGRYVPRRRVKFTIADLEALLYDQYVAEGRRSAGRVKHIFKHLCEYFEGMPAVEIGPLELNGYVRARREVGAAPATIQLQLDTLHHAFALAVRAKRLHEVPTFPRLQVDNARRVFVDAALLDRLMAHMPPYLQPVFRVALLTGWRKEAILWRQWSTVDLEAGWLFLEPKHSKNAQPVQVALIPSLLEIFRRQRALASEIELRTGREVPWCFFYYEDSPHYRAGNRIVDFDHAGTRHVGPRAWPISASTTCAAARSGSYGGPG